LAKKHGGTSVERAQDEVTTLLQRLSSGDSAAMAQILPLLYDTLHDLAAGYLRNERPDHTLQPTALVNEAYLKLVDQTRVDWQSRSHFIAIAATAMRRILVDHARGKSRKKRAADGVRVALPAHAAVASDANPLDLVDLDAALDRLGAIDPRKVQVIEMRFFAGLSIEQTAEALEISPATVKRDWEFARLWLLREMNETEL
jgi:RNA polymerase sigma-70 factor, ECF subfamily